MLGKKVRPECFASGTPPVVVLTCNSAGSRSDSLCVKGRVCAKGVLRKGVRIECFAGDNPPDGGAYTCMEHGHCHRTNQQHEKPMKCCNDHKCKTGRHATWQMAGCCLRTLCMFRMTKGHSWAPQRYLPVTTTLFLGDAGHASVRLHETLPPSRPSIPEGCNLNRFCI